MQNTKNKVKILIYAAFILVLLIIIFLFSNQVGDLSYSISNWFSSVISGTPVGTLLSKLEMSFGFSIRKDAHMLLYFILGIFASLFFILIFKSRRTQIPAALLFCLIAAAFDEWHQTFVPGRTGRLKDVGIDAIGFVSAIIIVHLLHLLFTTIRKKSRLSKSIGIS